VVFKENQKKFERNLWKSEENPSWNQSKLTTLPRNPKQTFNFPTNYLKNGEQLGNKKISPETNEFSLRNIPISKPQKNFSELHQTFEKHQANSNATSNLITDLHEKSSWNCKSSQSTSSNIKENIKHKTRKINNRINWSAGTERTRLRKLSMSRILMRFEDKKAECCERKSLGLKC
jgi:hypothetical protein